VRDRKQNKPPNPPPFALSLSKGLGNHNQPHNPTPSQNPAPAATDFRPVLQGPPAPKPYRRHPCLLRNPVPASA